jgi:hypothetical protein
MAIRFRVLAYIVFPHLLVKILFYPCVIEEDRCSAPLTVAREKQI